MRFRAAFVIAACLCAALCAGEQKAEGHALSVVKTWTELAQQPALELRKNATARLGIQTLRAPHNSAVMIYCLTEAYDPADEPDGDSAPRVGPFRLFVQAPKEDDKEVKQEIQTPVHAPAKRDYGRLVFGQLIALEKVGTYTVEVRDDNNSVVASAKIECVDRPFHPWSVLPSPDEEVPNDTELEGVSDGNITTAAGLAGLPKLNGSAPLLYVLSSGVRGPRKFADDDPLPTLPDQIPKAPALLTPAQIAAAAQSISGLSSNEFNIRSRSFDALVELGPPAFDMLRKAASQTSDAETLLRIRSIFAHSNAGFSIRLDAAHIVVNTPSFLPPNDVEHYFLARWWLNGKPVAPNNELERHAVSEDGGVPANREARLKLKFDPKALGAKQGDTVGLQLLFCPDGTRSTQEEPYESTTQENAPEPDAEVEQEGFPDRFPVVSNKIEFTIP